MWSLGCVLFDLLQTQVKRPTTLFRGEHCSPLSPRKNKNGRQQDDQIVKILERYPQLDPKTDFSFASDQDSQDYLSDVSFLCTNQDSVEDILMGCNPDLVRIVTQML